MENKEHLKDIVIICPIPNHVGDTMSIEYSLRSLMESAYSNHSSSRMLRESNKEKPFTEI